MFFFFSKVLAFLLQPMVWIVACLLYAWKGKNEKWKKRCMITGMVMLLLFSNRFIFDECMRLWEVEAVPEAGLKQYDAVIVLGGMSTWDPTLQRIQFSRAGDRLMQALTLYKKGLVKNIVFTGGSGSLLHPEYKEGKHIHDWLQSIGIPDSVLIIENESRNTYENAVFTKKILDKKFGKNGKYLLVSSGFHLRRGRACFVKAGFGTLDVFSTDRYSGPRKLEFEYLLIPDAGTMADWERLLHEIFGFISYKIGGYA